MGSVDARGPAPGSRELALLAPDKPLHYVNGLVLTGGSAFGLATADGVMRYLAEKSIGHPTPIRPVPIVPAAVVYDLFMNGGQFLPGAAMGYDACLEAREDNRLQGADYYVTPETERVNVHTKTASFDVSEAGDHIGGQKQQSRLNRRLC